MTSDSRVDERTLREIYLPTFEKAVKEAQPWTIMCSYNRVNGIHASESERFLTEILRDEWGFKGFVVSDWGAVNDRVKGVKAGLDLEMPSSYGQNDKKIVKAVLAGELDEKVLDLTVERILKVVDNYVKNRNPQAHFDREKQHIKAKQIAGESMVLLKNNGILPLGKKGKVALIGAFAKSPRFQGGGSSHINTFKESNAYDSALQSLGSEIEFTYAAGYSLTEDAVDPSLLNEAVKTASKADVAVIFAGLPDVPMRARDMTASTWRCRKAIRGSLRKSARRKATRWLYCTTGHLLRCPGSMMFRLCLKHIWAVRLLEKP